MRLKKFVVFASGGGTDFQSLIDAVGSGQIPAQIVGLIAGKPDIYAIERAKKANIPVSVICKKDYSTPSEFDIAIRDALTAFGADFAVLAGYLSIIGPKTIEAYKNRIINIHPALIPSFCGMGFYGSKVHEAVVASGVKLTGATVHFVDEEADTGPIIMQTTVEVCFEDSADDVAKRVLSAEHKLLPQAVCLMAQGKLQVEGNRVKILK